MKILVFTISEPYHTISPVRENLRSEAQRTQPEHPQPLAVTHGPHGRASRPSPTTGLHHAPVTVMPPL